MKTERLKEVCKNQTGFLFSLQGTAGVFVFTVPGPGHRVTRCDH